MCCNGVIFADVKLFPDEEIEPLLSSGIPVSRGCSKRKQSGAEPNEAWRFLQPCAGFDGCRCRIYAKRPTYCRQFECLLFRNVLQGTATQTEALRIIRNARRRVDKVKSLLHALGDKDETIALARRFRRLSRRLERSELDEKAARLYGELTLAFHDLSLLLSEAFYPAPLEK
jgi:Fe-S-cluster containining protein